MSEIVIQHLTKEYKQNNTSVNALKDINLKIESGDIFGIIGMSGAGKSTLVRCLNFLERPTTGQVVIDGQSLENLSEKALREKRREISMIFQHFNLLEQKNVVDNVAFPLTLQGIRGKKARETAVELLKTVGLGEKLKAYPSQLSGGQKQRVAIARALATNPKILLCDEATSALDPQTTEEILALLKDINERLGITIVIITHQMSVVRSICNKVAILSAGELVETGSLQEIFQGPKSNIAKKLIFSENENHSGIKAKIGKRVARITFEETSAFEPVIANLILKFQAPINILGADTKNVNGSAQGEMLISVPEDPHLWVDMENYLKEKGVHVQEVTDYVG